MLYRICGLGSLAHSKVLGPRFSRRVARQTSSLLGCFGLDVSIVFMVSLWDVLRLCVLLDWS